MKKLFFVTISFVFLLSMGGIANATNGDNLIGIGPIARAMGGVGVAAPQDSISAVFANPAAMCFGPYCPGSQVDFGGTVFLPPRPMEKFRSRHLVLMLAIEASQTFSLSLRSACPLRSPQP
jgi:hypothetical protein